MIVSRHSYDGAIERAATQVIDQQVLAVSRDIGTPITVRVLYSSRRRLLIHADDSKAGQTKTLHREKPLVAVGVCRNAYGGFQRLLQIDVRPRF